jgi:hypothetical protein
MAASPAPQSRRTAGTRKNGAKMNDPEFNSSRCYGASGTPIELAMAFLNGFRGFWAKMSFNVGKFR